MPLISKHRAPDYFQDPELDQLISALSLDETPGRISASLLRQTNQTLGRREQDLFNRLRRSAGDDPLSLSEGIGEIHEATGRTAVAAIADADLAERSQIRDSRTQRAQLLSQREDGENRRRMFEEEANRANQGQYLDLIGDALGLGANIYGIGNRRRMLEELYGRLT